MESLSQLRNGDRRPEAQRIAANYLAGQARKTNSRILSLLAVKASNAPFKKISKMIKDMINKLMEEAADEAEHKGFCDTELGSNKITRDSKSEEAETLRAEIEELGASITKLSEQIGDLTGAVADIDAALTKATSERQEEKAKNTETIEDAKVAKAATEQ